MSGAENSFATVLNALVTTELVKAMSQPDLSPGIAHVLADALGNAIAMAAASGKCDADALYAEATSRITLKAGPFLTAAPVEAA